MKTNDLKLFIGKTPKRLKDVRPGVCIDEEGYIIFKTEYSRERNGKYVPECYNEAGEFYCGDYDIMVYPINIGE